jgi:anti-anti-sigma regulatory factor
MNIQVEHYQGRVPVAVLRLQGDLDGSNYREVIARAQELYRAGDRDLLVDMGATPYMSSSGVVALHTIALLFRGAEAPDPETDGWRALKAVGNAPDSGKQEHVKLLSPQPRVAAVLDQVGLKSFFDSFSDQAAALASF